jgi:hypothetical protein
MQLVIKSQSRPPHVQVRAGPCTTSIGRHWGIAGNLKGSRKSGSIEWSGARLDICLKRYAQKLSESDVVAGGARNGPVLHDEDGCGTTDFQYSSMAKALDSEREAWQTRPMGMDDPPVSVHLDAGMSSVSYEQVPESPFDKATSYN